MAKVRIRNLKSVLSRIEKIIGKDLRKKAIKDIADMSLERIKAQTRIGKSLPLGTKLPPLKESTKAIRKWKSKAPVEKGGFRQGQFFKPNKSNLTQTGQLIDSTKAKVNIQAARIVIEPTGSRNPSLGESDITDNKLLARDLAARGFKYLGLDARGIKRIKQILIDEIRRLRLKAGFK